ncbi:MAG: cation:proton antiporter regulatory subunit [Bacteroidia bacterium]
MELRETHLPGVGRKYTLRLRQGGTLMLLVLNTGQREIFWMSPEDDEPSLSIKLTEEEAREAAFILGGVRHQPLPADKMNLLLQEMVMEWILVESDCVMAGRTLAELELRRRTGVSVIAILREGKAIPSPDPYQDRILPGDTLVVIGTRAQIERVFPLCRAGG